MTAIDEDSEVLLTFRGERVRMEYRASKNVVDVYKVVTPMGKYHVGDDDRLYLWRDYPDIRCYPEYLKTCVTWLEGLTLKEQWFRGVEEETYLEARKFADYIDKKDKHVSVTVRKYVQLSDQVKRRLMGVKRSVDFKPQSVPLDPYLYGRCFGGNLYLQEVHKTRPRTIENVYLYNSRDVRVSLLSGIVREASLSIPDRREENVYIPLRRVVESEGRRLANGRRWNLSLCHLLESLGVEYTTDSINDADRGREVKLIVFGRSLKQYRTVLHPIRLEYVTSRRVERLCRPSKRIDSVLLTDSFTVVYVQ